VSACKDLGPEFPDLEEADIQVVLDSLAAFYLRSTLNSWQCLWNEKIKKILMMMMWRDSWLPVLWRKSCRCRWGNNIFEMAILNLSARWRPSWYHAEEGRALESHFFLRQVLCLPLCQELYIVWSSLKLAVRNTNVLPVIKSNRNVFVFIDN